MYESPRMRRLRNDLAALERLRSESSVFRFTTQGDPPQHYRILFQGRGLWRDHGKVKALEKHHVEIKLGSSYPRTMPELRWLTPIYHPNISEIGMVCLGGYGTHWVPSIQLDELCIMLWDMLRYHNYDIRSPYNRDAALWVANQTDDPVPDRSTTASRPSGGAGASGRIVGWESRAVFDGRSERVISVRVVQACCGCDDAGRSGAQVRRALWQGLRQRRGACGDTSSTRGGSRGCVALEPRTASPGDRRGRLESGPSGRRREEVVVILETSARRPRNTHRRSHDRRATTSSSSSERL